MVQEAEGGVELGQVEEMALGGEEAQEAQVTHLLEGARVHLLETEVCEVVSF